MPSPGTLKYWNSIFLSRPYSQGPCPEGRVLVADPQGPLCYELDGGGPLGAAGDQQQLQVGHQQAAQHQHQQQHVRKFCTANDNEVGDWTIQNSRSKGRRQN